jgi:hypothetical protein
MEETHGAHRSIFRESNLFWYAKITLFIVTGHENTRIHIDPIVT